MKKDENGRVVRRTERGVAVSIYFPNAMRPVLERLYDLIDEDKLNSQLKARLADDALNIGKSNAVIGDEFAMFFHRHQGQVLGAVDVEDIDMEMMFKQWCMLVSLPISVWQGAFLSVCGHAV